MDPKEFTVLVTGVGAGRPIVRYHKDIKVLKTAIDGAILPMGIDVFVLSDPQDLLRNFERWFVTITVQDDRLMTYAVVTSAKAFHG